MVMLSATIDKPEKFAAWCENRDKESHKKVILTGTEQRVVPLKHYVYLDNTDYLFKILKDKPKEQEIKKFIKQPQLIKEGNKIHCEIIDKTNKLITLMNTKSVRSNPTFILNSLIKYLYKNNMLPAICFVFSRANVEKYAHQITVNLFDYDDAHVPSIMQSECDKIIRKLSNYNEYKELKEYKDLVSLMSKGVAIHHSGMMPILREMVEIIFGKGFIKVLFATETFAVGINMPTKTVIFTAMTKYTNDGHRHLLSHEYTQMAGRAGRRGLDVIGHVIHCNNLFREKVSLIDYKNILSGKPQVLKSKFKISYSLLLNLIALNKTNYSDYVRSSMLNEELTNSISSYDSKMIELDKDLEKTKLNTHGIDVEKIKEYMNLKNSIHKLNNKKRKHAYNSIQNIESEYGKNLERDISIVNKISNLELEKVSIQNTIENINTYVDNNVDIVIQILFDDSFIEKVDSVYSLTPKGKIASSIHEANCLIMADMIYNNEFDNLSVGELVSFMSCFTNISVMDDFKTNIVENMQVKQTMSSYIEKYNKYSDIETKFYISTGMNDSYHFDITKECLSWCEADDEEKCVEITNMLLNKGIFIGEFVKAILKINNITNEFITACEYIGNIKLSEKLNKIPDCTLKYIILQQSLYV
jgi:superfamily II RNA helicase